jgi:hypothetical protein
MSRMGSKVSAPWCLHGVAVQLYFTSYRIVFDVIDIMNVK